MRNYLRKRDQLEIAEMQDRVVHLLMNLLRPPPIFHGGTVIWRVLRSPRFSEHLDIYHTASALDLGRLLKAEVQVLHLTLTKFRSTKNMVYSIIGNRVQIRLEISKFRPKLEVVDAEYETTDGSFIVVKTPSPEDLLREKVAAYIDRRKARDLYDVYYLLNFVDTARVQDALRKMFENLTAPPADWAGLEVLILRGLPPAFVSVKRKIEMSLR